MAEHEDGNEYAPADNYIQDQMLGKGAYGCVYLVTCRTTGKKFAMKLMEVRMADEGVPQSVVRELATLSSLSSKKHPNITILHEAFHTCTLDGSLLRIYMVMEKCDWDLYTFLRDIPQDMPHHQCKLIVKQMFNGVDFLHSHNIIHRDLKPQNILINRDQTVKIADYGLSRTYMPGAEFTTTVVTLWYRSPELLLQTSYNSSIDLWALGVIIPEVFCRRPLLNGQTEAQQLMMTFQKLGSMPAEKWPRDAVVERKQYDGMVRQNDMYLFPRVPTAGIDLINRCIDYDPSKRCSAAQALKMPFFDGVPAAPPRAPPPPVPFQQRQLNFQQHHQNHRYQ